MKSSILGLRAEGLTYAEISQRLGCSKGTVSYHCSKLENHREVVRENRTSARKKTRRYEEIPSPKVPLADWLILEGVSRKDIASALNLDYPAVLKRAKDLSSKRVKATSNYAGVSRRRAHLKMLAVARLGGCCEVCGYKKSIRALSFHHRDPEGKDFNVGGTTSIAWNRMRNEIDKCQLLCENCHREIHDISGVKIP